MLIFEKSVKGRTGVLLDECDVPAVALNAPRRAQEARLPEVSEIDVIRHYTALSKKAHGVDDGFYPLGSCTMKYNPRVNDAVAALSGFTRVHPLQGFENAEGCVEVLDGLSDKLCEITGMDAITLHSPAGSHKPNTALPQAYYNAKQGIKHLTTETGGGQWGSAIALASQYFGLDLKVFMVKVSYEQKPYRKLLMNTWGAEVIPSPSTLTDAGRRALADDSDCSGNLGLAISEAVETAVQHPDDTRYCLGSVLNHVLLHQTVIGEEALVQMEMAGDEPDVVIGCFGGGSNFAGIGFPFLRRNLREGARTRIVAVEPASCPKLTRGTFQYDFGDVAGMTPMLPMYTLGHNFQPADIHAGGLRYHGAGSIVSQLLRDGLIEAQAVPQLQTFRAGLLFARTEGIVPAPESTHAIAAAVREALRAKEEGASKTILFNLSGHGMIDLYAYEQYFADKLQDYTVTDAELRRTIDQLDRIIK